MIFFRMNKIWNNERRPSRNNSNRPAMKTLMKILAERSFCSVPDNKTIIAAAIQRIDILQSVNEEKEEQIRTLILQNLNLPHSLTKQ